jgi:DNA-binding beta-propeller fold protein YncE
VSSVGSNQRFAPTRRGLIAGAAALGAARVGLAAAAARAEVCAPQGPGIRTEAIAISPSGRTLWTADSARHTVTAHARKGLARGRSIDVGGAPIALAISPDGRTLLALTSADDHPGLAIVDLASGGVARVDVGSQPHSLAISRDGASAYVSGGGAKGTLTRVGLRDRAVGAAVALGAHPHGLALTPDGKHALVALNGEHAVLVVTLSNAALRRVATPDFPSRLAISPGGRHALVTHNGYASRSVTPIDVHRLHAGAPVHVGAEPRDVAYAGGRGVVVLASGLALVDGKTARRRRRLAAAGDPRAVVVHGAKAFVADRRLGSVMGVKL